jgi:hypothetical protein
MIPPDKLIIVPTLIIKKDGAQAYIDKMKKLLGK